MFLLRQQFSPTVDSLSGCFDSRDQSPPMGLLLIVNRAVVAIGKTGRL